MEPDVRFSLANERTLLAYQRTAIGLVGAAVAVAHFIDGLVAMLMACLLIVSGAVAAIGGYVRYLEADRAIRTGRPLGHGVTPMLIAVFLVLGMVLAAVSVLTS
jgi:putative membrane protein